MTDTVIELLGAAQYQKDADGIDRRVPAAPRPVFAKVGSVTRSEFFNAGRNGLNPEFVFSMFAADYHGETALTYNGEAYAVYRTYLKDGDYIELYAERKGGTNGAQNRP